MVPEAFLKANKCFIAMIESKSTDRKLFRRWFWSFWELNCSPLFLKLLAKTIWPICSEYGQLIYVYSSHRSWGQDKGPGVLSLDEAALCGLICLQWIVHVLMRSRFSFEKKEGRRRVKVFSFVPIYLPMDRKLVY